MFDKIVEICPLLCYTIDKYFNRKGDGDDEEQVDVGVGCVGPCLGLAGGGAGGGY